MIRYKRQTDYEGFVSKFSKGKKSLAKNSYKEYVKKNGKAKRAASTDECFTPKPVYDAVVAYLRKTYPQFKKYNIVRPFYPDKEYTEYKYKKNDIVLDNPPFSIMAEILDFYHKKGIKYFLFANGKTMLSHYKRHEDITVYMVGANITYENGAQVLTSFYSNMFKGMPIIVDGRLKAEIKGAKKTKEKTTPVRPTSTTSVEFDRYINSDTYLTVDAKNVKKESKGRYGGSVLLSKQVMSKLQKERTKKLQK